MAYNILEKAERIILVGDQIVFIKKDGEVLHCEGSNEMVELICNKGVPIIASIKMK